MENIWLRSALWIELALLASLISICIAISVALVEIVVGTLGGNLLGMTPSDLVAYLAGVGAIVLTFLAGTEIDPSIIRRHVWPTMSIGVVGFLARYLGVLAYAHFALGWPWPQAQIAGIALSTTSVAVVYAVMVETDFNRTEIGKIILAGCFVNDLGTVLALGIVFANYNLWVALFAAMTGLALWLLPRFVPWYFARVGERVSEPEIKFLLLVLFLLGGLGTIAKSEAMLPAYLVGMVLAPFFLRQRDIAHRQRMIALIVILLRAGFELSKDTLNRIGYRVMLLSAVPAIIEGTAITFLGPPLLGLTYLQSAILGSVLAAVSPAVVVPLMIRFIERDMGAEKGIPTLVLAVSAIDDVFVIVIYSILVGMLTGQDVNIAWSLAGIPISIALGIEVGITVGLVLFRLFRRFNPRATKRVLVILGLSVLLVRIEHLTAAWVPFAALLAVMDIGFIILERDEHMAHEISAKLGKIWVFAEIMLFTMIGVQVNVHVALAAGLAGAAIIGGGLLARSLGTWLCLLGTDLNRGERLFVVIAYIPKATVQAAIGGGALAAMRMAGMDTGPGEIILAVAVLSILLTAPLGAWAIAIAGERWLVVAPPSVHDAHDAAIESEAVGN